MDIIEIFWTNVDRQRKNRSVFLRQSHENVRKKRAGINLRTVEEIAKCLEIDDYSVLFKKVD